MVVFVLERGNKLRGELVKLKQGKKSWLFKKAKKEKTIGLLAAKTPKSKLLKR